MLNLTSRQALALVLIGAAGEFNPSHRVAFPKVTDTILTCLEQRGLIRLFPTACHGFGCWKLTRVDGRRAYTAALDLIGS